MFFSISDWYLSNGSKIDKYVTLNDIYNNCNEADAKSFFIDDHVFAVSLTPQNQYITSKYCSTHLAPHITSAVLSRRSTSGNDGLQNLVRTINNQKSTITSKINELNGEFSIQSFNNFTVWTELVQDTALIKGSEFLYFYNNFHDSTVYSIINARDYDPVRYIRIPSLNLCNIPGIYVSSLSISMYTTSGNVTPTSKDLAIINKIQSFAGTYSYAYGYNVAYIFSYNLFTRNPVESLSSKDIDFINSICPSSPLGDPGLSAWWPAGDSKAGSEVIEINLKTLSDSIIKSILQSSPQVLSYWNEGSTDYNDYYDCFTHRDYNSNSMNVWTYITSVDINYCLYNFLGVEVSLNDGELEVAQWNNLYNYYYTQLNRSNYDMGGNPLVYPTINVNGTTLSTSATEINIPHYNGGLITNVPTYLIYDDHSPD